MSSWSQALTVVGYAVGSYFGYPQLGAIVGGIVGGQVDLANTSFDVPKVGDTKTPQSQMGAKLLRLYGNNKTAGIFAWFSEKRIIPGDDGGGKGDEPTGPTPDTAEIDLLVLFSIDSVIAAVPRIWKNGELIYTQRTDSDTASVAASADMSAHWDELHFLDGNPAQMPHPVIEASDGVGNVSSYRYRQGVLIKGLKLGQSGQIPLLEFETCQRSADGHIDARTVLQSYFPEDTGSLDISYYEQGAGTVTGTDIAVGGLSGAVVVDRINTVGAMPAYLTYTIPSTPGVNDNTPLTIEFYNQWEASPNVAYTRFFEYIGAGSVGEHRFGYYGDTGLPVYDNQGFGQEYVGSETPSGRTHYALVFGATSTRAYINGIKVWESAGDGRHSQTGATVHLGDRFPYTSGNTRYTIDEFAIRREELYTGDSFGPPGSIKAPDSPVDLISPLTVDLGADIVEPEWARVADPALLDASDLYGIPVRGFQTSGSVRGGYETLAGVFHWGMFVTDKAYCVKQGAAVAATIPYAHLGAGENSAVDQPYLPEFANPDEIALRKTLTFPDYLRDYNAGTQTGDRGPTTSSIVEAVQTNVVMTPGEAKAAAQTMANQAAIGAMTGKVVVTDYYCERTPTDRLALTDEEGTVVEVRIMRTTDTPGMREFEWMRDDLTALVAPGITSDTNSQNLTVLARVDTEAVEMNIPPLRDADVAAAGFYAAGKPADEGKWAGYSLAESADGTSYVKRFDTSSASVIGRSISALPDFEGGALVDAASTLTVDVGAGQLSSITTDAFLAGTSNIAAIGSEANGWEIVQFKEATQISAGVYELGGGMLRGLLGTEWAVGTHVIGDRFVLLDATLRRVGDNLSDLNVSRYFKAVSFGKTTASASANTFADTGVSLMPIASEDLVLDWTDPAALVATWNWRSRYVSRLFAPIVNSEASLSFDVELRDGTDTLIDSATVTAAEYSLPPGIDPTGHTLTVWKLSEQIGRGYPATLEIA